MKAMLDHVALNVRDFEWYLNFFEEVFYRLGRPDGPHLLRVR